MNLHNYQERAIQFVLDTKACYLAIDLGMGKTAIALKVIERLKIKALVFAPVRVCYTSWPEEIKLWTPQLTYRILHGETRTLVDADRYDILLMNYESLKWLSNQRGTFTRRLVVFDESSMVKSHSADRFNYLQKMQPFWLDYRICLSATPSPNNLYQLWPQYYLLDGGKLLGKNITAFRKTYCVGKSYPGMPVVTYKVDPRFEEDIYKKVAPITFRLDAKDYLTMPEVTYNQIKLDMPPLLYKRYRSFENEFLMGLDNTDVVALSKAALSMKLRQFIQGFLYNDGKGNFERVHQIKLNVLKELIETSAGNPILCAVQFKAELAMIREYYPNVPIIAGGTPIKDSLHFIDQWNKQELPLLLCHPASLSHGVNLQSGGHIVLWYGLPWSLELYLQLNGRINRQGQKNPVIIHHFVMTKTVDTAIIQALTDKQKSMNAFLNYLRAYRHDRDGIEI